MDFITYNKISSDFQAVPLICIGNLLKTIDIRGISSNLWWPAEKLLYVIISMLPQTDSNSFLDFEYSYYKPAFVVPIFLQTQYEPSSGTRLVYTCMVTDITA